MELKGKKIVFLGDSITEGCGVSDKKNIYWQRIGAMTGAEVYGYGIGGTRIALQQIPTPEPNRHKDQHFASRVDSMIPDADIVVDTVFLPEFPRLRQTESGWEQMNGGQFQSLYYGTDGTLHSAGSRWEETKQIPAGENVRIFGSISPAEGIRGTLGSGHIQASGEVNQELTATTRQTLPAVTGITLGQEILKDPMRPSLILCRPGRRRLWDLAREAGTTVEAIRSANNLTEDPEPERMLLIPVP